MRILLTLPRPFFPADTGGKIRSLNIFSRLAAKAEIHAISFADPVSDAAAIKEMKAMFASYHPVFRSEAVRPSARFYRELMASQFDALPYFLAKTNASELVSTAAELTRRKRFDLLFCDFLHTAAPLMDFPFRPRVVFEHNVEFLLRKRKWQAERHPLKRFIFQREWAKTRTIEEKVCQSFDHVITVSKDDSRVLRQEFDVRSCSSIPTGVDTDFFRPPDHAPEPGRLVFVGSMDWHPNEDGMLWFLHEVFPRIRRAAPGVSLSIVGRSPSSRLRAVAAGDPSVEITGWVADVRPHLARAEVVVVPLLVGGGTRIKIPEAMAMAKPVVSTPVGAEGLPFQDGREIRIAERPGDFAQAVLELLRNAALREEIGMAAHREVVAKCGWDGVTERLEQILDRWSGPPRARRSHGENRPSVVMQ
ncbi:MAG TPA: glycosyltransferase [Candidatus Saccharimonadales bacterium]|jgi:glycosyltransferase involved in cell wall biosynthesis|nr:glycosyltransferase [Candidatus Saccharimonadales bacterium]